MKKGDVEVGGSLSMVDTSTRMPVEGDPAIHVATTNALGHLRVALTDSVSIGGQIQGAHLAFSRPNAMATPPLREDLAWGIGPNVSLNMGVSQRLSLGGSLALTYMNVPWAAWELEDCKACKEGESKPNYSLRDSGRDSQWLYRASVGPVYSFNENFDIFGGFVLQNMMTNIGFDNTPRADSTLSSDVHTSMIFTGFTARTRQGPFLRAQIFLGTKNELSLFTSDLGVQMTLGLNL
jgi:hypothetical protein